MRDMSKSPARGRVQQEEQDASRNSRLLYISALQFLSFVLLARWVRYHPVDRLDVGITRQLQKHGSRLLQVISDGLSLLCAWQFMALVTGALAFRWWKARRRLDAVLAVSVPLVEVLFRKSLQRLIGRPRPSPALVHVARQKKSASFPSGHATTALTGWGWLLVLVSRLPKRQPLWRKALLSGIMLVITLAGPSRIYLGEHWTSDVVGGYLFGGAWLSLSCRLYRTLKSRGVFEEE